MLQTMKAQTQIPQAKFKTMKMQPKFVLLKVQIQIAREKNKHGKTQQQIVQP